VLGGAGVRIRQAQKPQEKQANNTFELTSIHPRTTTPPPPPPPYNDNDDDDNDTHTQR
jgi:hypothetical protein